MKNIIHLSLHAYMNKYYPIVFVCLYALMNLNYDKYNTSVSVCIILTNIAQISWHSYMNKILYKYFDEDGSKFSVMFSG